MFVITTLSMERMQITECLSAPLDILLMAKVTVLQPEVRHNTVFAQATPCLQSSAEVNEIRHRSLTSTNSHFKRGHVVVEYSNPIEFPPQNRYWLPHDRLVNIIPMITCRTFFLPVGKLLEILHRHRWYRDLFECTTKSQHFLFPEKRRVSKTALTCVQTISCNLPLGLFSQRCMGPSLSLYPEGQGKARLV